MKFLADMGISPRIAEELRKQGHDAVHLAEQGLYRMPDGDILQKARLESRVLLTHDLNNESNRFTEHGAKPCKSLFPSPKVNLSPNHPKK